MLLGEASSSRPGDETEYADSDAGDTPRAQHLQVGTPRRARASTHLIDLTNTPFNMAKYSRPAEREGDRRGAAPVPVRDLLEDSADDFTRLPQASIKFTLPPRADAIYREARAKTPARGRDEDETTKKLSDLLADITSSFSPSPGPIPAELRRYSIMPSDLGPGRKLFDTSAADASRASKSGASPAGSAGNSSTNIFAPTKDNVFASDTTAEYETLTQKYTVASTSAAFDPSSPFNAGPSQQPRHSVADTSFGSDDTTTVPRHMVVADDSDDSFDDDTMQDLRGPAAQDAVAAAAGFAFDDSYMSDDESFIAQQGQGQGRGEYTDTMVGGGERTTEVFGRPGGGRGQFALHQQDEMLTYHGGRLEDAQQPATPLGGGSADISSLGQHHY
jgi:DASH complex subunit ASK1